MNKSKRMKPVKRIADSKERDAAKALGESQRVMREQEDRLAQLKAYREEYRAQVQRTGSAGVSAGRLQELHRFMNRLDEAIAEQEKCLQMAEQACEERRRGWFDARGRSRVLDKVVARYQEEERADAAKHEQKELDEFAQRKGGKEG